MSGQQTVLVIGGGLAGLSAACELVDAGFQPIVIEKRPFLGGRVYSYMDKRTGMEVDNGQHVFLRCCTEYIHFLEKLGVFKKVYLQSRLRLPVIDKISGESVITSSRLPAPLHALPSFLRYRSLSMREKMQAVVTLTKIRSLKRSEHKSLDDLTFADWLRQNGQSDNAIRNFWNLIVQPTLNDDAEFASADLAVMVFQEGFLKAANGADIGYAKVGLSALLTQAAQEYIESGGGQIQQGQGVKSLLLKEGRLSGVKLNNDKQIAADHVICAVPPWALIKLLPIALKKDPFFTLVAGIESTPIVNVHLWYDHPITDRDFVAFVNSPLQWLFNKSKLWGHEDEGQYLDISLSGADEYMEMSKREIVEMFKREVQAFFPKARTARLKRSLVVKQADATFAPRPGVARLRPPQRTPVDRLFLAGDWTDTGWPATMESAVRSGVIAAREITSGARITERKGAENEENLLESEAIAWQS